jgi:hypothetical protein
LDSVACNILAQEWHFSEETFKPFFAATQHRAAARGFTRRVNHLFTFPLPLSCPDGRDRSQKG